MTKKNEVVIKYRPLGRHKAIGLAYTDSNLIEIDSRLKEQELFYVLCHELCHLYFPDMEEENIIDLSTFLTIHLWSQNFRKVDQ